MITLQDLQTPGFVETDLANFFVTSVPLTAEGDFIEGLADSGLLPTSPSVPETMVPFIRAELSFIRDEQEDTYLFNYAAQELALNPIIQDLAAEASLLGIRPVQFLSGAFDMQALSPAPDPSGYVIRDERLKVTSRNSAFLGPMHGAGLIADAMILGGVASAYDSMNGTHTLNHIESALSPNALMRIHNFNFNAQNFPLG